MKTYFLHLQEKPFENIKNKKKTVEMRLYDEKRREYKPGDELIFENNKSKETIKAIILDIKVFPTFKELYSNYDKEKIGYLKNEKADPKDMEEYYSQEQQLKYRVCAIELKLKDN